MKRLFLLALTATSLLAAVPARAQQVDMTFRHHRFVEDTLYLGYYMADQQFLVDTTVVKDGVARFQREDALRGGIFFIYQILPENKVLLTDLAVPSTDQEFTLVADDPSFDLFTSAKGSEDNDLFIEYQLMMRQQSQRNQELTAAYQATLEEDSLAAQAMLPQLRALANETRQKQEQFIDRGEGTYFAALVQATLDPQMQPDPTADRLQQLIEYRRLFLQTMDFSYDELVRTPFLKPRLDQYLDKLTHQHPDSLVLGADRVIEKAIAEGSDEFIDYIVRTVANKYETSTVMGHDGVFVHIAQKYILGQQLGGLKEEALTMVQKRVAEISPTLIGKYAPDFTLFTPEGNPVSLYDIQAKYTVLFFYDPGCGHCRTTAPILNEVYDRIKQYDVKVVAAITTAEKDNSSDNQKVKWDLFREEHEFGQYINLADLKVTDPYRQLYNIVSTPLIVLLDQDKKILARRLTAEQLLHIVLTLEGENPPPLQN